MPQLQSVLELDLAVAHVIVPRVRIVAAQRRQHRSKGGAVTVTDVTRSVQCPASDGVTRRREEVTESLPA